MNKLSKRDLNVITGGSRIGTEINLDSDSTHVKQIYLKSPKALATGGITASTSSITITNKQNTTTTSIYTTPFESFLFLSKDLS
jgi:hypothetical protein